MENNNEQHVTFRQMRRSISLHELSNTSIFDSTMLSLPNTSNNTQKSCCEDLRSKVETLTNNLLTATNEIDILHDEINNLKTELAKCVKVIEVYKKLELSDSSVLSNRKKKRLSMHDMNRASLATSSPTQKATITPSTTEYNLSTPCSESSAMDRMLTVDTAASPLTSKPLNLASESPAIQINLSSGNTNLENNTVTQQQKPEACNIKKRVSIIKSPNNTVQRQKVIVLGDDQGWNIRHTLQALLGNHFQVLCFWKPGAKTTDVLLNSYDFDSLNKNDYVVILTGINDTDPLDFQIDISVLLRSIKYANIIVSEVPFNKNLNEKCLNSSLRHLCNKFNGVFVNMGYSQIVQRRHNFTVNICRHLLKEILRIDYKTKFMTYIEQNCILTKLKTDQSTQTCNIPGDDVIINYDRSTQTNDHLENIVDCDLSLCLENGNKPGSSNFFRV